MRSIALLGSVAIGLALAGCGDESTAPPVTPSLGIEFASPAVTLAAGGSGSVAVNISCNRELDRSVSLALATIPAGVSARLEPSVVAARGTSTLRLEVDPAMPPGIYMLTVSASVPGIASTTALLFVSVTAPPAARIGLGIGIDTLVIGQGQNNVVPVTLSREHYADPVELTVSDVPAGITAKIYRAQVTAKSPVTMLLFSAAPAISPGSYRVTVTATATGITAQPKMLTINVTEALREGMAVSLETNGFICLWEYWQSPWPVHVTRLSGYSGPIDLTVEGLPPGVESTLSWWAEGDGMLGSVLFEEHSIQGGSDYGVIRARGVGVADAVYHFRYCTF